MSGPTSDLDRYRIAIELVMAALMSAQDHLEKADLRAIQHVVDDNDAMIVIEVRRARDQVMFAQNAISALHPNGRFCLDEILTQVFARKKAY